LFALGVPGAIALVMIVVAYPDMLAGPFPMISGLAKTYWFDRIHQERGALIFVETQDYRSVLLFCAALATVGGASIGALRRARDGDPVIAVLVAVAWAAVLVTLFSNRFLRITLAFVPLLLPVALGNLRTAFVRSRSGMTAATATIGCSIAALLAFSMLTPSRAASYDAFDQLIMNDCRLSDFSALGAIRPGRIITPPGLGLQILYRATPGITVSSISFHRAAAAMSHALELYMTSDRARRIALLEGADYLAVCHSPVLLKGGEKLPLFRDLLAGVAVPGLTEAARSGDLVIFKVDHGAL
jgi:hypothetical protein